MATVYFLSFFTIFGHLIFSFITFAVIKDAFTALCVIADYAIDYAAFIVFALPLHYFFHFLSLTPLRFTILLIIAITMPLRCCRHTYAFAFR